ncbi:unnamed protein product [Coregonus sp. 'balchen']|nr:unnamed protein product [Coregonus sp. 'balchen']
MATSEPTATGGDQDPNSANLRPSTNYDAWMQGCTRKLGLKICEMLGSDNRACSPSRAPPCNTLGFLQKNNSLGEEGRIAGSLSERKNNLFSCDNSDRDARFQRTETDFSNMFARDLLPAKNGEEATMQFLLELVDILTNYVRKTFDRSTKVLDFHHPHQLLEGMEGFNLELSDQPESLEQILVDCRDTLKYGVRTGHPRFFNQLSTGLDIIGPRWGVAHLYSQHQHGEIYGAFDPINEIADICEKYNMWLHVDGAWGGGLLMSRKHRHKFSGVERANSVTWNPHKMMGPDKQYDVSYDTGDKAIQCGRHVDIFKFWLMWKAKGTIGFEQHIDKCLDLSQYLYDKIRNREGYEMVFQGVPQHTNVCFWYIPPSLRGLEHNSEEYREKLHMVAPKIKAMMMESGTTMVGYQPQGQKVNFFRMVVSNPAALQSDIDFLIDEIERLGHDL